MSSTLKLAFLGCGGIARFHLEGIRAQAPRIAVTAAVDVDPARAGALARETGAATFSSLDDALARGDFDAVDIMLPHDLHEGAAVRCLEAGKHVLLEKPMAPTLDACDRILAAARRAGTVFMVAENAQYWPEVVEAQEAIAAGAIGEPISARARFANSTRRDVFLRPNEARPWRFDAARMGGGIVIDGGSHWIRPLRMWFGEIDAVVATLGRPLGKMDGESLAHALLRFRSGRTAAFEALYCDSILGPDDLWRITGTEGEIAIGGPDRAVRLYNDAHREGKRLIEPAGYAASFGPELADFAQAVLDGTPLGAEPEESLGELRTALAIYRSATSGAWEDVW